MEEYFKIPTLVEKYGDVQEIPNCLVKDMYNCLFYQSSHLHPNLKYRDRDGGYNFTMAVNATKEALKQIESRMAQSRLNSIKASLKTASENADFTVETYTSMQEGSTTEIDKLSITDESNIVIVE